MRQRVCKCALVGGVKTVSKTGLAHCKESMSSRTLTNLYGISNVNLATCPYPRLRNWSLDRVSANRQNQFAPTNRAKNCKYLGRNRDFDTQHDLSPSHFNRWCENVRIEFLRVLCLRLVFPLELEFFQKTSNF